MQQGRDIHRVRDRGPAHKAQEHRLRLCRARGRRPAGRREGTGAPGRAGRGPGRGRRARREPAAGRRAGHGPGRRSPREVRGRPQRGLRRLLALPARPPQLNGAAPPVRRRQRMADSAPRPAPRSPQGGATKLRSYVVIKTPPKPSPAHRGEGAKHNPQKARVRKSSILVLPLALEEKPVYGNVQHTYCNIKDHPLCKKLPNFHESSIPAKHLIILKLNQCMSKPNIFYYQKMVNVKVDTLIEIYNYILEHNDILRKTVLRKIFALFKANCFRKTYNQTKFDPAQSLNMLDPTDCVIQTPRLLETSNLLKPPSGTVTLVSGDQNNSQAGSHSPSRSSSAPPGASCHQTEVTIKTSPRKDPEPPSTDWLYLKLVYEICYIALQSKHIDEDKFIKGYITQDFIAEYLELFESSIEEERLVLKSLVHKLYSRFLSARTIVRNGIYSYLDEIIANYQWDYAGYNDNDDHKKLSKTVFINDNDFNSIVGITDILDFLSCIISGYTVPLKEEHINMLKTTLFQLHKHPQLRIFYPKLLVCIKYYLLKSNDLILPVLENLINLWPRTDVSKQLLFINEVREVISLIKFDVDNSKLIEKLAFIINISLGSTNAKIIDETLNMFSDNAFINIISRYSHEIYSVILPNLVVNLRRLTDKQNSTYTLKLYKELHDFDQLLFETVMKNHKIFIDEQIKKKIKQEHFWEMIIERAKIKINSIQNINFSVYVDNIHPSKCTDTNIIDWSDETYAKMFLEHNTNDSVALTSRANHPRRRRRRNTVSVARKV